MATTKTKVRKAAKTAKVELEGELENLVQASALMEQVSAMISQVSALMERAEKAKEAPRPAEPVTPPEPVTPQELGRRAVDQALFGMVYVGSAHVPLWGSPLAQLLVGLVSDRVAARAAYDARLGLVIDEGLLAHELSEACRDCGLQGAALRELAAEPKFYEALGEIPRLEVGDQYN